MKSGLVIADSGPIFSLATVDKLPLLDQLFDSVKIPQAVWEEITLNDTVPYYGRIVSFFEGRVERIKSTNELSLLMDPGESESIVLYRELEANFLLIDDKKARQIAENYSINCIGTLGLLIIGKKKGLIDELRPIFICFIEGKRYYSIELLNSILLQNNEKKLG